VVDKYSLFKQLCYNKNYTLHTNSDSRDVTEFESKCCRIPIFFFANPKSDTFSDSFRFGFSFHFVRPKFIIRRNPSLAIQK